VHREVVKPQAVKSNADMICLCRIAPQRLATGVRLLGVIFDIGADPLMPMSAVPPKGWPLLLTGGTGTVTPAGANRQPDSEHAPLQSSSLVYVFREFNFAEAAFLIDHGQMSGERRKD